MYIQLNMAQLFGIHPSVDVLFPCNLSLHPQREEIRSKETKQGSAIKEIRSTLIVILVMSFYLPYLLCSPRFSVISDQTGKRN